MQQVNLFGPSDRSAESAALFAQVVFNHPVEQPFTYAVPPELAEAVAVGQRVLAPFGRSNRATIGYVVELTSKKPERAVKPIKKIIDDEPVVTPVLLRLTKWMAEYYLCGWGHVLDSIVPAAVKEKAGTRLVTYLEALPNEEWPNPPPRLSAKQAHALRALSLAQRRMEVNALAQLANAGRGSILGLVKKGYAVQTSEREEHGDESPIAAADQPQLTMNPEQLKAQVAIQQAVMDGGFHAFLLHGVTGSGKTEVYLQAIQQVVQHGKEALVMVPEISLTPQAIERFRGRFPYVAVLHSHLSAVERARYWRQIAAGRVQVVVGARSAVFAPTQNLGLIVVDEEHENSFKQDIAPRYHGRDVAVLRAQMEGIPIILGSATPSLESWHNAKRGQYKLLSLTKRVENRPLPNVELIDLRYEPRARGPFHAISPGLERAMRIALDRGGQVILFLNRRGYSTYLVCPACGEAVKCKFCDVTLTHHRQRDLAICHYCGFEDRPPDRCPNCAKGDIRYLGQGTEKLEAEISAKFPKFKAERMDSDTMRSRGSHARVLDNFREGDTDILLGTQMIAKGLDFPNVTLVGVVNADIVLHMPDFRSAERTFQLLAQVAGRTGRGAQGGRVLVQTMNSEHPCIALAAKHDFGAFAEQELKQRQEHHYPPFARMARVILRGKEQQRVEEFAEVLAEGFRKKMQARIANVKPAPMLRCLGPAPAPLVRLKGYHRYHFQIQSTHSALLHDLLREMLRDVPQPDDVEVVIDVDPLSML